MNNIELLKDLTQTTFDSVEGYRQAAEKTDKSGLKRAFEMRRDQRSQILSEMNRVLIENGAEAVTTSSLKRKSHDLFTSITDAFDNGDDAVIERVEEGEDYIANQFQDALNDDAKLAPEFRTVIEKAYKDIREGERFTDMLEKQYA